MAKVDVGDPAPGFELPGTGGKLYRLSDYRGEKVVLAFYPGDGTRVCTAQFCSYRDEDERISGLDAEILGISPQSVASHERWAQEKRLNVPLLADENMEVSKAYGVRGWASPLAKMAGLATTPGGWYVKRSIFVIDADGAVRYRDVSTTGATYKSAEEIERAVAAVT